MKINGKLCYLWRAVDHEGEVLETVVTAKRDQAAALKFLKRIMKKYGRPRSVVANGLCSYPAAMREIGNADQQEVGRRLNDRAENSCHDGSNPNIPDLTGFDNLHKVTALNTGASITFSKAWVPKSEICNSEVPAFDGGSGICKTARRRGADAVKTPVKR